ncbi:MAG: TIGR03936 family radical SAM-associated protein [Oscillospiraceae bacterium]|nr:TIGR03936 family radical SAM-associated protein [Oscillospiraceae bacterium]
MDKLRLLFEKTGRAAYISHLDLMRTMQRAFLRAGLPLKYSEGFNPHAQISMLLPLSLGHESLCELMDFRVGSDCELGAMAAQLTEVLPEGIRVQRVYEPERKGKELKWLRVSGRLEYDAGQSGDTAAALEAFFARESIVIHRRTKRGEGDSDIRPAIRTISAVSEQDRITLEAVVSAQEPTLNPDLLVSALRQLEPQLAPDYAHFTRVAVYDAQMRPFE